MLKVSAQLSVVLIPVLVQTILGMTQTWPAERDNINERWTYLLTKYNKTAEEWPGYIVTELFCEKLYNFEESPYLCQKANGLSSYAFVIPAMYAALHLDWCVSKNLLMDLSFIVVNIGNTMGNLAYHGFCLMDAEKYDELGFMSVLSILTVFAWTFMIRNVIPVPEALADLPKRTELMLFSIVWFGVFLLLLSTDTSWGINYFNRSDEHVIERIAIFGSLIVVPLCVEAFVLFCGLDSLRFALLSLASVVCAFVFWYIGHVLDVCWATSWFQFHSLWHLFTALSVLFVFVHMKQTRDSYAPLCQIGILSTNFVMK